MRPRKGAKWITGIFIAMVVGFFWIKWATGDKPKETQSKTDTIKLIKVELDPTPNRTPTEKYKQVLDEIAGVEFVTRSLTPDASGSTLAYIHEAEQGRGLYLLDLKTLKRTAIPLEHEVSRIFGWSADSRYLAVAQEPKESIMRRGEEVILRSWVTILDLKDGSVRRLTKDVDVAETYFSWLNTKDCLFVSRKTDRNIAEIFMGNIKDKKWAKVSDFLPELLTISDKLAAAISDGNIINLELRPLQIKKDGTVNFNSRYIRVLSDFDSKPLYQMKWLRYSQEAGNYLFCAQPAESSPRYVFQYSASNDKLTQLNDEDTYNAQWIQKGTGFAYVGNTNNSFFLAIRTQDPNKRTNLFLEGSVVNYTVAPDGEHIYVTASQGCEPQGLWEYTISNATSRLILNGTKQPWAAARLAVPREFRTKSFDGVDVPWFLLEPQGSQSATPATGKHPVILFLPPSTGQFQKTSFDARAQMLANLGFYFVAINYRGCDGYGSKYALMKNPEDAAKDVVAVYREIIKNLNIDTNNVFLSSSSSGSDTGFELLAKEPKLWRAAAFENPPGCFLDSRWKGPELPALFISSGDGDPGLKSLKELESWARKEQARLTFIIYSDSGHVTYRGDQRKDKLRRVTAFFLDHMEPAL